MNEQKFSSLDLHADLLNNLNSLGYQAMTAVQAKSLPLVLAGRDVIAQAKTGSGKTAAFGLGLLQKLEVKRFRIQSLVLCPTRELSDQVAKEIRKLARGIHNIKVLTLCGGMPFGPQAGSLEHGAHIIVGTPGRIEDHIGRGTLKLDDVNMLILDEADRMLDMGFQAAVDAIIDQIPDKRQTLLFSATFPDQIQSMINRVMNNPALVKIEEVHDNASIEQHFYKVSDNKQRLSALRLLLLHFSPESTIVFCNTKKESQQLADKLNEFGFSALALHGDLEQRDRDVTLVRFSNKSVSILVATDVAARGLDIDALDAVINYHIAHDAQMHTHRVGRTGRAGQSGIACSLYSENESHKVAMLDTSVDPILDAEPLPSSALLDKHPTQPVMVTIRVDGGKKQKVRAGDILGALTGKQGIEGKQVGKIQIFDNWAYVAVNRKVAKPALQKLMHGKLKGRTFRASLL
jgi:ATP-independent RNA helicase DbpA